VVNHTNRELHGRAGIELEILDSWEPEPRPRRSSAYLILLVLCLRPPASRNPVRLVLWGGVQESEGLARARAAMKDLERRRVKAAARRVCAQQIAENATVLRATAELEKTERSCLLPA